MKKTLLLILLFVIILFTVNIKFNATHADYMFIVNGTEKSVSEDKWEFKNLPESLYSKNYIAREKREGHKFEQVVTVFLQTMSSDDKTIEDIASLGFFEAFVVHPDAITYQIRIDKGDYWVMSRETFEHEHTYPMQTNISYSELVGLVGDFRNKIDNTKFILENEF